MRVTAAFSRLLDLPGVWVKKVRFGPGRVVVWVALRRKRLCCPKCSYSTMARENVQDHDSVWRAVDLGLWRLEIRCRLRRLRCPEHGAHVEGVPFARDGARFTRDFEDVVAWLATKTDQTATCRLLRIDWETVGRIIKRVGEELLPADRLSGPVRDLDRRGRMAQGPQVSDADRRSPRGLRGVGHRGQGAGRR